MNSMQIQSMIAYKLRKLSQSGMAPQELAARMQELLETDRKSKMSPLEQSEEALALPLFGRRAYLNVV